VVTAGSFYVYPQPVITAVTPATQQAGDTVTIGGTGLAADAYSTVTGAGFMPIEAGSAKQSIQYPCVAFAESAASTAYTCTVPLAPTNQTYAAYVQLGDGPLIVSGSLFAFAAPTVTAVSTSDASTPKLTQSGCTVTITGTKFSKDAASNVTVMINNQRCTSLARVSDTSLTCTSAPDTGEGLPLVVTVDNLASAAYSVSFREPRIASSAPGGRTRTPATTAA
jgi:hypothetical protein